jgi:hypothetical protein
MSRATGVLLTICLVVLGGCFLRGGFPDRIATVRPSHGADVTADDGRASTPTTTIPRVAPLVSEDPYAELARQLNARGVAVWFEADLVTRWLEGPQAFQEGLDRLASLSRVPGVQGFKVADELGYNDRIDTPEDATAFLRAVRTGLDRTVPHAQVLIDVVVPELGCLGWTSSGSRTCTQEARAKHPATTEAAVTGYLRQGLVDRLDLSTSLLDEWTYRSWGMSQAHAQEAAWAHVNQLGWNRMTELQSRKALADAGGYQGSPEQADSDVHTFVDLPLAAGAGAVDVWTWRQQYDGRTVSLLDPHLADNPLWERLAARHQAGVHLFTHMTPSLMLADRTSRDREYALVAAVFDGIFVAAGTG